MPPKKRKPLKTEIKGIVLPLRGPPSAQGDAVEELLRLIAQLRGCLVQAEDRALRARLLLPECGAPDPTAVVNSRRTLKRLFGAFHLGEPLKGDALVRAEQDAARKSLSAYTTVLRRWLSAWQGVNNISDDEEFAARMHFTNLVDGCSVTVKKSGEGRDETFRRRLLLSNAQDIIRRVHAIYPAARIDSAHLASAIERWSRGKRDWKCMVMAWGRRDVDGETWRVNWMKHRK